MPKCSSCGRGRPVNYVLCRNCWREVPRELKIVWYAATGRDERIEAADRIYRWVRSLRKRLSPGVYSHCGQLVIDVPELLAHLGIADTSENRAKVIAAGRKSFAQARGIPTRVVTEQDLDPH